MGNGGVLGSEESSSSVPVVLGQVGGHEEEPALLSAMPILLAGTVPASLRPTWEQTWMDVADLVAKRSLCSRAQVGCVVVTSDNRIEAATYNGPSPQFQHFGLQCEHWCQRQMTG